MEGTMSLRVAHLYPGVMNIYGDRGNVIALQRRGEARGIEIAVVDINVGDRFDADDFDLVLIGGGQDREQRRIAEDLVSKGPELTAAADAGMPGLVVCGGYQLFGHGYIDHDGSVIPGIGLFDIETRHPGPRADRCIGDIVIETPFGEVVGFENHGGRTYLAPGQPPLGTVVRGFGNNAEDGTEGARYKDFIGTYLHGSLLPKNPQLTDTLLEKALKRKYGPEATLSPLDDSVEQEAHRAAVGAAIRRSRKPTGRKG
jgi:lipid II isoglutaminyl synthase (glutamine-hydrolysing)